MKKALLIIIALFAFITGFAQMYAERLTSIGRYSIYPTFWSNLDSTLFKYNGARGSHFNFNTMDYCLDGTSYVGQIPFDVLPMGVSDPVFQGDNISVRFSKKVKYVYGSSVDTSHADYDLLDRVEALSDTFLGTPITSYRELRQYDPDGRLSFKIGFNCEFTALHNLDTYFVRYYSYNADGALSSDSTLSKVFGSWHAGPVCKYNYNSAGNISSIRQFGSYATRYDFTYNSLGRLETRKMTDMTNGHLYMVDSFGWQPDLDYYVYSRSSWYSLSGESDSTIVRKHISEVTQLPDTITTYRTYAFYPDPGLFKSVYEYNAHNNPVKVTGYTVTAGGADSATGVVLYHYKPYVPTGVSGLTAADVHIYPNPAYGLITVEMPELQRDALVTLTDLGGRVVITTTIAAGTTHASINTRQMAAGIYVVHICNDGFTVTNKIVVAN